MVVPSRSLGTEPDVREDGFAVFYVQDVTAVRDVRMHILQAAMWLQLNKNDRACVVFGGKRLTSRRMSDEVWHMIRVLSDGIVPRLGIGELVSGRVHRILPNPNWGNDPLSAWRNSDFQSHAERLLSKRAVVEGIYKNKKPDARFVILQLLLHEHLGGNIDNHYLRLQGLTNTLAEVSGYSHVTVARILSDIKEYVKTLDRQMPISLSKPDLIVRELMALAPKRRGTQLFTDRSGLPRSMKLLYNNFKKLNRSDLAIGGIIGAKHYAPDLDISGTPRFDITVHCENGLGSVDFIHDIDPGLQSCEHEEVPVLAVHFLQRHKPLFEIDVRQNGVLIADRVECLLDLDEIGISGLTSDYLMQLRAQSASR